MKSKKPLSPKPALLLVLLPVLLSGCDRTGGTPAAGPPAARVTRVKMVRPARHDVVRRIQLPATVRARFEVTLYAKATGFVKSITKDRGDRVKAGEVIAALEVPEMILELEHARASAAMEDTTLRRLEAIRKIEKTAVTDQDYDLAQARRTMAESTLKRLQTLLNYAEIRAPFDGYVTERFVDPGAFVQQAKIVSIVDASTVRIVVDVPEAEARFASVGAEAEVRFDALPGGSIHSKVARSSAALDPLSRTMRVELDVTNTDLRILPGMFAHVDLGVERHLQALVVPFRAIIVEQEHSFVFVNVAGTAKRVAVTTGAEDGDWLEACAGLTGDESIILPDGQLIVDGMQVQLAEGT
jgi:RND family efflux transporter MFP subunit